jgi:ribosomal-protein-alanine N-acetyltransferase
MIPLESQRLILRSYKESDLPEYHQMMSDRVNMHYLQDIVTRSLEESRVSLREAITANTEETARRFAVTLKGSDALIGGCGYEIAAHTPKGKIADPMGWSIMPPYQNKGYMTEAVKRVLEFAFLQDDCVWVITGCFKENIPTQKIMIKTGFIEEEADPKTLLLNGRLKERMKFALSRDAYKKV